MTGAAPILTGEGLRLRPWSPDDVPAVLSLIDDVTRRWSPSLRSVRTAEDAQAWLALRLGSATHWAITDPTDGTVIGRIGLHHVSVEDATGEVGYGVVPAHRGQGIARRAVSLVDAYAFAPPPQGLGLVRVILQHAVGNVASCRVADARGFGYEGSMRKAITAPGGAFDDAHLHARVVGDPPGPLLGAQAAPQAIEPTELVAGPFQLCIPNPDVDAAAILAAAADPEIARWNAGPKDLDAARAWCTVRADWSDGKAASWVVKDTSGLLVGQISAFQIDRGTGSCQVGYWVAPGARRRGVASAALDAARRFVFEGLGLTRMELFHAIENLGSCGVARAGGFALEGIHRSSYRYGDGLLHDEHSHARLATDG